ncbi:Nucleoside-diphosphate-sugar epimerases [hydrothermal vent metagenome]|uniref:Nucleoside-diphosphate-sugar epimerases n=1 Tax=hydrothermal vent metagenome TaxID=652676 RepID=A0A3B1DJ24_9ZZZZ
MSKLVIGCGYLGLRVALRWLKEGEDVFALTRSKQNALRFKELGIQPVLGDVTIAKSLQQLPQVSTILHAVGYDRKSDHSQRTVYVDGLRNLLAAVESKYQRIIFISSTSVYGQNCGEWVDENSPRNPVHKNGIVCRDAEDLFWKMITQQNIPQGMILRCAGLYGPGRLLRRIETLKSGVPISGRPDAWLNIIHIEDVVQTVLVADSKPVSPASHITWNLSDDQPVTRKDYYNCLASSLQLPSPHFEESPQPNVPEGTNKRCCNKLLKAALNQDLLFPTIHTGLTSD